VYARRRSLEPLRCACLPATLNLRCLVEALPPLHLFLGLAGGVTRASLPRSPEPRALSCFAKQGTTAGATQVVRCGNPEGGGGGGHEFRATGRRDRVPQHHARAKRNRKPQVTWLAGWHALADATRPTGTHHVCMRAGLPSVSPSPFWSPRQRQLGKARGFIGSMICGCRTVE
jgi:hypothetical protein